VERLVELPIEYPGVEPYPRHQSYLVVNGLIDDVVRVEIEALNRSRWVPFGFPALEVVQRPALVGRMAALGDGFWPLTLQATRRMLELYLSDGSGFLDQSRLSGLLESALHCADPPGADGAARAIAGAGLATGCALAPFAEAANHAALIAGWTVYLAAAAGLAARLHLRDRAWASSLAIAEQAVDDALGQLVEEATAEGPTGELGPFTVDHMLSARATMVLGLSAVAALWPGEDERRQRIRSGAIDLLRQQHTHIRFWGEGATPYWLAVTWGLERCGQGPASSDVLSILIGCRCSRHGGRPRACPSPYLAPADAVDYLLLEDAAAAGMRYPEAESSADLLQEDSYVLESLVHLLARRGSRGDVAAIWPAVSRMRFAQSVPDDLWERFRWRFDHGMLETRVPNRTQSWRELREEAERADYSWVPTPLRERPHLVLLFLMAYPHRLCPDLVKLLDDGFRAADGG
jgi:hypothetical protein